METIRVKRKGQVTIPAEVRRRYEIKEGDLLDIETSEDDTIVMKIKKFAEPGSPVGLQRQKRIMSGLRKTREKWR